MYKEHTTKLFQRSTILCARYITLFELCNGPERYIVLGIVKRQLSLTNVVAGNDVWRTRADCSNVVVQL